MSFVYAYTLLQLTIQVIMYRFIVTHIDFSIEIVLYCYIAWWYPIFIYFNRQSVAESFMRCCAEVQQHVSTTISPYVSKSTRQCVNASVQQHVSTSSILWYYCTVHQSFTILIYSSYSISILIISNFWSVPAGRYASRPACGQTGRLAGVLAGRPIGKRVCDHSH